MTVSHRRRRQTHYFWREKQQKTKPMGIWIQFNKEFILFVCVSVPLECGRSSFTNQFDWKLLCDESTIRKHNNKVHLKVDFECSCADWRTCEETREDHVHTNGKISRNVSICNLNILNFCRCLNEKMSERVYQSTKKWEADRERKGSESSSPSLANPSAQPKYCQNTSYIILSA
jgi:hypothetical protein